MDVQKIHEMNPSQEIDAYLINIMKRQWDLVKLLIFRGILFIIDFKMLKHYWRYMPSEILDMHYEHIQHYTNENKPVSTNMLKLLVKVNKTHPIEKLNLLGELYVTNKIKSLFTNLLCLKCFKIYCVDIANPFPKLLSLKMSEFSWNNPTDLYIPSLLYLKHSSFSTNTLSSRFDNLRCLKINCYMTCNKSMYPKLNHVIIYDLDFLALNRHHEFNFHKCLELRNTYVKAIRIIDRFCFGEPPSITLDEFCVETLILKYDSYDIPTMDIDILLPITCDKLIVYHHESLEKVLPNLKFFAIYKELVTRPI